MSQGRPLATSHAGWLGQLPPDSKQETSAKVSHHKTGGGEKPRPDHAPYQSKPHPLFPSFSWAYWHSSRPSYVMIWSLVTLYVTWLVTWSHITSLYRHPSYSCLSYNSSVIRFLSIYSERKWHHLTRFRSEMCLSQATPIVWGPASWDAVDQSDRRNHALPTLAWLILFTTVLQNGIKV